VEWFEAGDDAYELEIDCDEVTGDFAEFFTCDDLDMPDHDCDIVKDGEKLECKYKTTDDYGNTSKEEREFDRKE